MEANFSTLYTAPPPTPTRTGAVRAFFQLDIMTLGSELYVVNSDGEWKIFQLEDFTGA